MDFLEKEGYKVTLMFRENYYCLFKAQNYLFRLHTQREKELI